MNDGATDERFACGFVPHKHVVLAEDEPTSIQCIKRRYARWNAHQFQRWVGCLNDAT